MQTLANFVPHTRVQLFHSKHMLHCLNQCMKSVSITIYVDKITIYLLKYISFKLLNFNIGYKVVFSSAQTKLVEGLEKRCS